VTLLDPTREIYPNAPLKLVAFELRFPEVPELASPSAEIDRLLRQRLPILGPRPDEVTFEVQAGAAPRMTQRPGGLRRLDRRRRESVTITPVGVTVETSDYARFESFREFIEQAMRHLEAAVDVPAVTRIGLRYIDEIDPDTLPQPVQWSEYIARDLLSVAHYFRHEALETHTAAVFSPAEREHLVLRYGLARRPIVKPDGPLHIDQSPEGPYFLIDIDSSWEAPADDLPEFSVDSVLQTLDRLHAPVRDAFEGMITEMLRNHLRQSKGT
jgi:uncharacterized protein (TIGR04255 family)